ncbi:MAG: hypothetical protein GYB64_15845 [Chloroflexi bacterium]|nr:hypothetical protein [Chloroflexota bacterium]
MKRLIIVLAIALGVAACEVTTPLLTPSQGSSVSTAVLPTLDPVLNADAQQYAEDFGVPLEEAARRMQIQQQTSTLIDRLQADYPDTFSTLWFEHEPEFRVVIGYTDGDASQFDPLLAGLPYAADVEPRLMALSEQELADIQRETLDALRANGIPIGSAWVDILEQQVGITAGNPDLLREAVAAAGIELHEAVVVQPANPDYIPPSNEGYVLEETTPEGQPILLIVDAPADAFPLAGLEGTLTLDEAGCLRIGGLVAVWPNGTTLTISADVIEVVSYDGSVLGRVGDPIVASGGTGPAEHFAERIPGYPADTCPGDIWSASPQTAPVD